MASDKTHARRCFFYESSKGSNAALAWRNISKVYANDDSTCRRWFQKFKDGDKLSRRQKRSNMAQYRTHMRYCFTSWIKTVLQPQLAVIYFTFMGKDTVDNNTCRQCFHIFTEGKLPSSSRVWTIFSRWIRGNWSNHRNNPNPAVPEVIETLNNRKISGNFGFCQKVGYLGFTSAYCRSTGPPNPDLCLLTFLVQVMSHYRHRLWQ